MVNCEKIIVFSMPSLRSSISSNNFKVIRTFAEDGGNEFGASDFRRDLAARFSHFEQYDASSDDVLDIAKL